MRMFTVRMVAVGLLLTLAVGCAQLPPGGGSARCTSADLMAALKASGYSASLQQGAVSQANSVFGVAGDIIEFDGHKVWVYTYASKAEQEQVMISEDGYNIQTHAGQVTHVDWIAPPHFLRVENLILFWATDDAAAAGQLRSLLQGLNLCSKGQG